MTRLPRRLPLPISSGVNILPGTTVTIAARSQLDDFTPDRVLIKNAERWEVERVEIQGRRQLPAALPASSFSLRGGPLVMSRMSPGGELQIRARYTGPSESGEPFECCAFGATGRYESPTDERDERGEKHPILSLSASASVDVHDGSARLVLPSPRTEEFWPERLVIRDPEDWVVLDIRVNGLSCMVGSGDLPGVMFAEGQTNPPLRIGQLSPVDELDVLAFYVGKGSRSEARIECTLSGPKHADDVSPNAMRLLPMSSGVNILPCASAMMVTSRVHDHLLPGQMFRPRRIVVDSPEDWVICDVKVGVSSQFAQSGDVPGVAFAAGASGTDVAFDPIPVMIDFVIVVTYVGGSVSGAAFVCGVAGEIVGPDHASESMTRRGRARV